MRRGPISNHHGNKHLMRSVVESVRGEEDAGDAVHMYAYQRTPMCICIYIYISPANP